MTSIWMGLARLDAEVRAGRVQLDGDPAISRAMQHWLKLSVFAQVDRRVA